MQLKNTTLGLILCCLVLSLSSVLGIPVNSICTEDEMLEPIRNYNELVEQMQQHDADIDSVFEKINSEVDQIHEHIETIRSNCGDEKAEGIEKLEEFLSKMDAVHDIISALDSGEIEQAKNIIEKMRSAHIVQYIIRKYATDVDKIKNLVEVTELMDDMYQLNMMYEGIIYILDDSNMDITKDLVPIMKKQIIESKDKIDPDMFLTAKLNLKEVAKRSILNNYEGLNALNEIDQEMADQAMYEGIFQKTTEEGYIPPFDVTIGAPTFHFKVIGLEAISDKLHLLEMQNGLIAGKVVIFAEKFLKNEEVKEDSKALEILNNIIEKSTIFAKNVAKGYSCQYVEEVKALVTGEEVERGDHNEYTVFYNPDQPEKISHGKFKETPDGDLMLITVSREFLGKSVTFSILVDNADYPDNIHMKGKITSKKIIGKEPVTHQEICAMNPPPQKMLCESFTEVFSRPLKESDKYRTRLYESYLEHVKDCE